MAGETASGPPFALPSFEPSQRPRRGAAPVVFSAASPIAEWTPLLQPRTVTVIDCCWAYSINHSSSQLAICDGRPSGGGGGSELCLLRRTGPFWGHAWHAHELVGAPSAQEKQPGQRWCPHPLDQVQQSGWLTLQGVSPEVPLGGLPASAAGPPAWLPTLPAQTVPTWPGQASCPRLQAGGRTPPLSAAGRLRPAPTGNLQAPEERLRAGARLPLRRPVAPVRGLNQAVLRAPLPLSKGTNSEQQDTAA